MRYCLLFIIVFSLLPVQAQNQAGKLGLEITRFKVGLNAGPYRGRTPSTNGPFNQGIGFIGQLYFPFQLAADYRQNFSDSTIITNEYNNRIFLMRPSAILHYLDNGSMAFGGGVQFSFLLTKEFYLEYQLSGIYVEANNEGAPDLYDGFNLHHIVSISKPVSRHLSLMGGIAHLSGAGIGSGRSSAQDMLIIGLKWNL